MAQKGGSAVDAAIAILLCVGVANAHSSGIGGGHFMLVYKRSTKTVWNVMAREMAPGAASENMFLRSNASSVEGGLAIAVPGELMGMWEAYKLGGAKVPWAELFEPTIKLCEDGVPVSIELEKTIDSTNKKGFLDRNPALRDFLTNPATKKLYRKGEKMKRPKYAKTLRAIAQEGVGAFYNGSLSQTIVKEVTDAGGIITLDDLKNYVAALKEPVKITLKNNITAYSPPPPSGGPVFQFILNILNGYSFTPSDLKFPDRSILTYHRIAEAMKFAFAKRTAIGDGDKEDQAFRDKLNDLLKNMTSLDYGEFIRSQIKDDRTNNYTYYGPVLFNADDSGTAHLSVLGPEGDAVSLTSTINLHFGSKVVGSETGIVYNNEMDDFSTPNTTNYFGIPASPANFIKPGKRPLSSMCPSMVIGEDGHVMLVIGASGGPRIITSSALVAINSLWFGKTIKESIDLPRIHHQLLPPSLRVEKSMSQAIIDGLKYKGHKIDLKDQASSYVQGVLQLKEGNKTANCDFRKYGTPDGY